MEKRKSFFLVLMLLSGFILITSLNSCVNSKKLAYFTNVPKDSIAKMQLSSSQVTIRQNDILKITIGSLDETTTKILNGANMGSDNSSAGAGMSTGSSSSSSPGSLSGYLVDETGNIKIPLIGRMEVAGLTKSQLEDKITETLTTKKIAIDPIVSVRIINFKITILGEVGRPGVISVPNERITVLEALGEAGDLTPFGKRNNILLVREDGDKRIYKRFSLNDDQIFNKDYYYLKNQDILYVEPNNAKAASADRSTQILPIIISTLSLLIVFATYLKTK
ncbi:polysaccharide biosynthesis/export family protein [Mucilaginibacter sp.]|uniref:polysaccharide biosynthesis/export family protein n=1 Tax=Mucilaginibacter sp. TaxID=1882438 RepID=UPI003D0AA388